MNYSFIVLAAALALSGPLCAQEEEQLPATELACDCQHEQNDDELNGELYADCPCKKKKKDRVTEDDLQGELFASCANGKCPKEMIERQREVKRQERLKKEEANTKEKAPTLV